jgi:hypothetical protein
MANTAPRTIQVGDVTVTIINAGDTVINMARVLAVPESEWRPLNGSSLEGLRPFPSQSIYIALPGASILVDINDYALAESLDSSYFQAHYAPPPGVVEQLLAQGIRPEAITLYWLLRVSVRKIPDNFFGFGQNSNPHIILYC